MKPISTERRNRAIVLRKLEAGKSKRQMDNEKISTLADVPIGVEAEVTKIFGDDPLIRQRLIVMGIVPGEKIRITKSAPLGDPLEIRIRGYNNSLMVRKTEAQAIGVRYE
jgi:Fe2+ transport system protein FeoA